MRIEILCTGDEILTGKTINTNYSHMTQRLLDVGQPGFKVRARAGEPDIALFGHLFGQGPTFFDLRARDGEDPHAQRLQGSRLTMRAASRAK